MRRVTTISILLILAVGCSERRPAPTEASKADRSGDEGDKEAVKAVEQSEAKKVSERVENAFKPQVAGQFYSADPRELRAQVRGFLDAALSKSAAELAHRDIVGLLVPHAGYRYSGPVAGEAYKTVVGRDYGTVVVLALSHRRAAAKAAVLDSPAYDSPLGSAKIDRDLVRKLLGEHGELFGADEKMFRGEHSLEVQLPFIQVALPGAKIVPVIVAVHDEDFVSRLGSALRQELGKRGDVLFAMSTDLSHYFPYDEAVKYDNETLGLLEKWKIDEWKKVGPSKHGMCGYLPTLAFVEMFGQYDEARRAVTRIDYRNSGDTSGDRARGVVGYGALAFSLEKDMRTEKGEARDFGPFTATDRRYLMNLAKKAVAAAVKGEDLDVEEPASKVLADQGAAFVTLKKDGNLRGCIGHVLARVPLFKCVSDVARSAAIHDRRFNPVSPEELGDLSYEISVLTAPEPTTPDQVMVGRDGLIMTRGGRSGLLLPQVPVEWNWGKEEFLQHTCRKAGLPSDCWKDPETKIESFRAIVWGEDDLED